MTPEEVEHALNDLDEVTTLLLAHTTAVERALVIFGMPAGFSALVTELTHAVIKEIHEEAAKPLEADS